jgi:HSP20 family protein
MADSTTGQNPSVSPSKAEATAPVPRSDSARHPLLALREEMDRLFDDFFAGSWRSPFGRRRFEAEPWRRFHGAFGLGTPAVDLAEDEKAYRITAELPGIAEKDIELTLANGVLTLKGEKREERETDKDYHVSERRYGSFQRSFRLPEDVDPERIEAGCKDGVLTVTLPKTEQAQAGKRRIEVRSGG